MQAYFIINKWMLITNKKWFFKTIMETITNKSETGSDIFRISALELSQIP